MIELSRHIERLLLDNECVIVPGLGGFVSYAVAARRVAEEHLFLPPMRTIGFNSRLILNDGLLIQSYMQSYDCSYPEASRIVEAAVELVIDKLESDGSVEFEGIGVLNLSFDHVYTFQPSESGILSPSLYGLSSFGIKQLSELPKPIVEAKETKEIVLPKIEIHAEDKTAPVAEQPLQEPQVAAHEETTEDGNNDKRHLIIRINRKVVRYAAAAAASVAMFFSLSTPVQNTYVEEENYASLSSSSLFEEIRDKSAALNILAPVKELPAASKTAVKTAKQSSITTPVTAVTEKKQSNAIVEETKAQEIPVVAPQKTETEVMTKEVASVEPKEIAKNEPKPEKPVVAKEVKSAEKVAEKTAPAPSSVNKSTPYKVIVSSFPTRGEANKTVARLVAEGYTAATVIEGSGRCRVAIASYSTSAEAYRKTNELRQSKSFADAWVLTAK